MLRTPRRARVCRRPARRRYRAGPRRPLRRRAGRLHRRTRSATPEKPSTASWPSGDPLAARVLEALQDARSDVQRRGQRRSSSRTTAGKLFDAATGDAGRGRAAGRHRDRPAQQPPAQCARRRDRRADPMAPDPRAVSKRRNRCSNRARPACCRRSTRRWPRETDSGVKQAMIDGPRRHRSRHGRRQGSRSARRHRNLARARRPGSDGAALRGLPADAAGCGQGGGRNGDRRHPGHAGRCGRMVQNVWYGLSLGSVLLLAAIGLAITFGVMGVINMAHGEMVMLGAYTTFVVQEVFRAEQPGAVRLFAGHRAAARVPGRRAASASLIERGVIRFLYGRPLETLLATWGLSPDPAAGGAHDLRRQQPRGRRTQLDERRVRSRRRLDHHLQPPVRSSSSRGWCSRRCSRVLRCTRVRPADARGDAEPAMAAAMGIRTGWVDALTFGLGSGIAGIAGVALSQIDNVSPNLGQGYIVDSFMVVVFGGVGNLWGTLVGALIARHRQQVPRALCRRGARQDPGAGADHPVHPEAAARPVRAQGPGGGSMSAVQP